MNIALIIYLALNTLGLGIAIGQHGKERRPENAWVALLSYIISISLVLWAVIL